MWQGGALPGSHRTQPDGDSYAGHDWVEPALARRSMELMAHEVWPRVTQALS